MRFRVEKRLEMPKYSAVLIPIVSSLIALFIMGLAITFIKSKLPTTMVRNIRFARTVYEERLDKYYEKFASEGDWNKARRRLASRLYSAFWNFKMTDVSGALRSYKTSLQFLEKLSPEGYEEYISKFDATARAFMDSLDEEFERVSGEVRESPDPESAGRALRLHLERLDSTIDEFEKDVRSTTNPLWIGFMASMDAYYEIFSWPYSPGRGLGDTFMKMVPLLFVGLGLIIVFQMKIWNIGAEGQYYLGVIATTWGALFLIDHPSKMHIPLLLLFGAAAGAMWGAVPGFLKAYLNMDEIVTTLMLNYVAFHWMEYLVYGPWKSPTGYNFPLTETYPETLWLPTLFGGTVHAGLFLGLVMAFVVYVIMSRTRWGFDLRVTGDNQMAARYAGINIKGNVVIAMMLSGALAGLAGSVQMLGVEHMLQHGYHPGYGYTGIIIAWLSRLNPWAVILVSFLFGGLIVGSEQLQITLQLPVAMVNVLQGILLFALLGSEVLFRYRIRLVKG